MYLENIWQAMCACRTAEHERLEDDAWRQWGPYLSERQWGTVREDHSHDGNWFVHIQSVS